LRRRRASGWRMASAVGAKSLKHHFQVGEGAILESVARRIIRSRGVVCALAHLPKNEFWIGRLGIPPTAVGGWFQIQLTEKTCSRTLESHQRQLVDGFRSCLQRRRAQGLWNPTHGSWWIVQILPPRQSGGSHFQSGFSNHCPSMLMNRLELNHPPTAVGGIS
jgi:hypothetical protein